MTDIRDDVLAQLSDTRVSQLADSAGMDPDQTRQVIDEAIPALLGGLANNTSSASGAESLFSALGDHRDANPFGDLGSLVSGALGGGILNHVLGGVLGPISNAISKRIGVPADKVTQVLSMIAPVVMAVIAKRAFGKGHDAGAVAGDVRQANDNAQAQLPDLGSILGGLFGRK